MEPTTVPASEVRPDDRLVADVDGTGERLWIVFAVGERESIVGDEMVYVSVKGDEHRLVRRVLRFEHDEPVTVTR